MKRKFVKQFHLKNKIFTHVFKKRIFIFGNLHSNPSSTIQKNGKENKTFFEIYHMCTYQLHYKDFVVVENLKFCNLETTGESVTTTSLLTLIPAGPLECYVQNLVSGVLKYP
jgi:hypothetical protein